MGVPTNGPESREQSKQTGTESRWPVIPWTEWVLGSGGASPSQTEVLLGGVLHQSDRQNNDRQTEGYRLRNTDIRCREYREL